MMESDGNSENERNKKLKRPVDCCMESNVESKKAKLELIDTQYSATISGEMSSSDTEFKNYQSGSQMDTSEDEKKTKKIHIKRKKMKKKLVHAKHNRALMRRKRFKR